MLLKERTHGHNNCYYYVMSKKSKLRRANDLIAALKNAAMDSICPFKERPSVDTKIRNEKKEDNSLKANDLFSIFTADIIKEEVIFTR